MLFRLILLAAMAAVTSMVAATSASSAADPYCGPTAGQAATAQVDTRLRDLFASYGNTSPQPNHWTGGDTTNSVPLPDGRNLWIFSDTFLGTVTPQLTRAPWPETPLVNNSIVIEKHGQLKRTLVGGTLDNPAALVTPADPSHWFWQADGTVENNSLRIFEAEWQHTGSGIWDFAPVGNSIASFSLPDLKLESVTPAPSLGAGGPIYWGAGIMEEGDWTYVYGSEDHGAHKLLHVARVQEGELLDSQAWQYWTGSSWSSDPLQSAPLLDGIENEISVTHVSTGYMLVTMDGASFFGNQIYAYFSCSPNGPFGDQTPLYAAPDVGTRGFVFVYNAHLHPELSRDGTFLITYNENSFTAQDLYDDVNVYRPRFIRVTIPGVTPLTDLG
jgi:hypothetical protein